MRLAGESASAVSLVLNKCFSAMVPAGPWRWQCSAQNGTRLAITASLSGTFLELASRTQNVHSNSRELEVALLRNAALTGGVRFALGDSSSRLHMRADIVLMGEASLQDRVSRALAGFHEGSCRMKSNSHADSFVSEASGIGGINLGELLRETAWQCSERGPDEFSAELDADSAPPARIRRTQRGLVFEVELVRSSAVTEVSRQALAVFLLTASGSLRMVRAHAEEIDGQGIFGLQVLLPPSPASEEIDHALAALSVAYRMCARETNVLLDEAVARCYLAARDFSTTHDKQLEKEN